MKYPQESRRSALLRTSYLLIVAMLATLVAPHLISARPRKEVIRETMPAVALIVAADIKDGQIVPVSSGSGTIVDSNGSVITNHHVLYDAKKSRLHDLFIVGLFRAADKEPELVCAGVPSKGMLKPEIDLALIRCDRDRDGNTWHPSAWPTLPIRKIDTDDIIPGEQVWVLGYPNVGGSTIHVTAGLVSGWTGENGGASSRAFMKTDASISHGNSGGTAIDEDGNFIGVPTAFRLTTTTQGEATVTAGRVGLIRPLDHALDLIAQARKGGPGSEGEAVAAPVPDLIVVSGKIVDTADGSPVEAVVIVFKQGLQADDLEEDKLDEQALSWTQTDASGSFRLESIPRGQSFTVAVIAPSYLPLVETNALVVPADAPSEYQPWKSISIQRK